MKPMSAPTAVVFGLFGVIAGAQSPTGRAETLAAAGVPAGTTSPGG